MSPAVESMFLTFLPMAVLTLSLGPVAFLLAREKGRNVVLWTILGFIPILNYFFLAFFMGAANLRLESKIDRLLEQQGKSWS